MEYTVYKSDLESIRTVASVFSSPVRIRMFLILLEERLSVTDLANRLDISVATASTHVTKLEKAGVIRVEYVNIGANKKMCLAKYEQITMNFVDIKKAKKSI